MNTRWLFLDLFTDRRLRYDRRDLGAEPISLFLFLIIGNYGLVKLDFLGHFSPDAI